MTRVALVHERFTDFAGSEQVVAAMSEVWPDAAVLAPIARPERIPEPLRSRISSTRLSHLVGAGGGYAHLLAALPIAMRHLNVGDVDVVVASHHAFADQVVYATDAPVIAYVHSPARWVWDPAMRAGESGGAAGGALLAGFAALYRPADRRAAARLTDIVANSTAVARRVADWWEQSAAVVHPPVDTEYFTADPDVAREDFFLLAGRLVPYKQPDVAVAAAEQAGVRLVVAGEGRMREACERLAGPRTTFVGRVSDDELRSLYRRSAATVMPGVEDFGIVPVEAQCCGSPVLATGAGGALDSVVPGVTGELVEPGQHGLVDRWARALAEFDPGSYSTAAIRAHAETFSAERFRTAMHDTATRVIRGS